LPRWIYDFNLLHYRKNLILKVYLSPKYGGIVHGLDKNILLANIKNEGVRDKIP